MAAKRRVVDSGTGPRDPPGDSAPGARAAARSREPAPARPRRSRSRPSAAGAGRGRAGRPGCRARAAGSGWPTRSSSRRGPSATASSTATSSTSSASGRSAARARRSSRGSATYAAGHRDAGRDAQLDRPPEPRRRRRHRAVCADLDRLATCRSSSTSPASRSTDYVEVARRLDGVPGVAGIELNISCPNVGKGGLQFAIDAEAAGAVTAAVRRATRPAAAREAVAERRRRPADRPGHRGGRRRRDHGDQHAVRDRRRAGSRTGRSSATSTAGLSGPAIKPVALRIVYEVAQVVDIPIVAIGGVSELARRPRLPGGRRRRGPGRDGDLRRPDAAGPARRRAGPSAAGAASTRTGRSSGRPCRASRARPRRRAWSTGP